MSRLNNFYPYAFSIDYFGSDHDAFLRDLTQQISGIDSQHKLLFFCYEWQPVERIIKTIRCVDKSATNQIIWLFTDSFYQDKHKLLATGADINFIEFDLLNLYFELEVYRSSQLNQRWNSNSNDFLFLTGKPNRHNRIRLLYKFYSHGLLDRCVWSLFMDDELRGSSREFLSDITDREYDLFVDRCTQSPDQAQVLFRSQGTCHYDGYPFDTSLYEKTRFRVIAETQMFGQPIITEKTWITMANRQPFIIAGYQHTLGILQRLGFKTFENYCAIGNYDSMVDDEQRLDAVVQNTQSWLEHMPSEDQMVQDIEHNYQLLHSLMNKTAQVFTGIYNKLGQSEFEIFRIIPCAIQRSQWINFYYGIKDSTWPDCFTQEQFVFLPSWVQKECIEVYNHKQT